MDAFGVKNVFMTSMQALSGAGRSPGVTALDILDNVIPYIPKEEEKVQIETKKILGKYDKQSDEIIFDALKVSCTCTRVPVSDGHTEIVFVETSKNCDLESIEKQIKRFSENISIKDLPSAPKEYIVINNDPSRPQPRIDREVNDGMTTVIGRLRQDSVFENGLKYVLLTHNEKMGSAKGAVLLAELLKSKNII
jgi:aspartate-semialdehyde dehydrogenase